MEIRLIDPPREFNVGQSAVQLCHTADIQLEAEEQVTFMRPSGAEYDVVAKPWGFYATPSINGRLETFGFRVALARGRDHGKRFVMLLERGFENDFELYLDSEDLEVEMWLSP
jgi:hypothetical protein